MTHYVLFSLIKQFTRHISLKNPGLEHHVAQETVEVFSVVTIDMKYSMSVSEMSRLTTFDKLSPSMRSVFMQDVDLQTVTSIDCISGI
jgi:hypothetical protein